MSHKWIDPQLTEGKVSAARSASRSVHLYSAPVLVQSRAAVWELRVRLRHISLLLVGSKANRSRYGSSSRFSGFRGQEEPNLPTALILSFSLSAWWSQWSSRHSNVEPRRAANSALSSTRSNRSLLSGWKPSSSSGQEKSCDREACR